MKSVTSKLRRILMIAAFFTAVLALSACCSAKDVECYLTKPAITYRYPLGNLGTLKKGSLKITSGKANASVKAGKQFGIDVLKVKPKKVGKTSVKFTITKNGKKKTYKRTFRIIAHENALKSLKIGSTDYASKFNKTNVLKVKKKLSGKLSIKPADGWKIGYIFRTKVNSNATIKLKNNKKMKLINHTLFCVSLQRGDEYRPFYIIFNQPLYLYLEQQGG